MKNLKSVFPLTQDSVKERNFNEARKCCKHCEGNGRVYHNDSEYSCSHGLSYQERSFNSKVY